MMKALKLLAVGMGIMLVSSCDSKRTMFERISPSMSGINFNNLIAESDSINPLNVVNIYNGGGVGIGDFNNDGLQDLYFTGNMVPSKLYLNEGEFAFRDITAEAGVAGMGRWARGVAIVDINNDRLLDIYVCNTIYKDSLKRRNILYINQGIDKDGTPHFQDEAAEYGLDISVQSTMAAFFDYDNDGDLDMYLTVNEASNGYSSSVFRERNKTNTGANRGRLYRNDNHPSKNHPVFVDVSDHAGISDYGFGHGATVCDLNNDGWKDIYVSDDFISNNILYINNRNGTFSNNVKEYFKHTSFNSMGQDVIDINNDALPDVIELDMNPPDNYRKKVMTATTNYVTYQNFESYGYQYQYVRNSLSLNNGLRLDDNNHPGAPAFSDIGFMSGIAETDWSWTPLVIDFDNDTYRDIVVTNGFPRDVSDHDFVSYRNNSTNLMTPMQLLDQIPEVKIDNYAFRNNGDLTFSDVSEDWGVKVPSFSNGAAYADLDNDGDMDMIVNNINDEAFVYRNTSRDEQTNTNRFLQVKFEGGPQNVNGLGAIVTIFYDSNKLQAYENTPYRGYLSTMQNIAHFGLGKTSRIDSVVVEWGENKRQILKHVKTDQVLTVSLNNASNYNRQTQNLAPGLFRNATQSSGVIHKHRDFELVDFNIQSVLPHKFSEYAPALASGDLDGNGLDDIVVGGNAAYPAQVFLQQPGGKFLQKDLYEARPGTASFKDQGILIFDANGDNKPDIYVSSGGFHKPSNDASYQDRFYINDGRGSFELNESALPQNHTSKLCVRAFDYNKDRKLDLFVSGRVEPGRYPNPVSSFIFRNDSDSEQVKYTDVTSEIAPGLKNIGLVCDALFTDFDDDNATDLILVGEWMPITFFKNENGRFSNVTAQTGVADKKGWWTSIVAGDFRNTGRTDYIVGNLGRNTLFKPNEQQPVCITAGDFVENGSYLAIPSLYLRDVDGSMKEFPIMGRDEIVDRWPALKKRYETHASFATATLHALVPQKQLENALRLEANEFQTSFLRNDGDGKFTMIPLPAAAQVSVINAMIADDFDGDGNLDVLMNGNDFGTHISIGRYDALNGLLLKGDGAGSFSPLSIQESGIYIPGDGKALIKLMGHHGKYLVVASQNKESMKVFELNVNPNVVRYNDHERKAIIHFKNGDIRKEEAYTGSSFMSQSASFINASSNVSYVEFFNDQNNVRKVSFTLSSK